MSVLRLAQGGQAIFWCPGCKDWHSIRVSGEAPGARWRWNGDQERPTFEPSVLVTSGHFVSTHRPGVDNCWCTYNAEQSAKGEPPAPYSCHRCHSFVREGRIQFLGDCSHDLAGRTIDLAECPEG